MRLVVDTGIHSKGWTRNQVVDYFRKSGTLDEPEIQTETDRYIAWPAQALSTGSGSSSSSNSANARRSNWVQSSTSAPSTTRCSTAALSRLTCSTPALTVGFKRRQCGETCFGN